jgi:Fic family protein
MYTEITTLSDLDKNLASPELAALSTVWLGRKSAIEQRVEYQEFLTKLRREWAIETGIIERLYTWDRGVTEVLIAQGIDASLISHQGGFRRDEADSIKNMIDDQLASIDYLFSFVKGDQPLTEHFIRSLQAQLTAHQAYTDASTLDGKIVRIELIRGAYKKNPNNPRRSDGSVHQYCPPELVSDEMQRLIGWYREYESESISPEVLSAWLHHRFTQIHPFQDGNGRVARALATLVFLRSGLFPLVIRDQERTQYIDALEKADDGEMEDLVKIFSRRQKDAILGAIGLEQQVKQTGHAEEMISSAIKALKDRATGETDRLTEVEKVAEQLLLIAVEKVDQIRAILHRQLQDISKSYAAETRSADHLSSNRHYFSSQIIKLAEHFGYFANLEKHRSWTRLSIETETDFEIVISIHGYGSWDSGVMVASALTFQKVPREDGNGTDPVNTRPACQDIFQFNYAEERASTEKRFRDWLEGTIALALAEWKRLVEI